ncbi:MAG: type II secretion system secretin GspD [Kiritimatiellae bacterium]|nr:type II secretion system secretin GspD [Kiritimatiellia bacterium]
MNSFRKKHAASLPVNLLVWMLIAGLVAPVSAPAQRPRMPSAPGVPPGMPAPPARQPSGDATVDNEQKVSLNFKDSPLEMVLNFYSQHLDPDRRTMIIPPSVNANITLKSQSKLTREEAVTAMTAILAMHNITLVPMGERFYKVIQIPQARQDGMPINMLLPEEKLPDTDELISQMIELNYLTIAEAQPVVQQFLHGYGKMQPMERINSLLITDTSQNIQRILEVLEFIDRPVVSRVETRVYEVQYAEAGKIAAKLNEIVADLQEGKQEGSTPQAAQPSEVTAPPGVIRPRRGVSRQPADAGLTAGEGEASTPKEIIQGKVKVIADDRTNILLVISDPNNFVFFDKIVTVLDRPVEPEISVHIEAMEYADAEEIAGILNDFIGAATSDKKTTSVTSDPNAPVGDARSTALQKYVQDRADQRTPELSADDKAKIGQLSSSTKILADKRTNSLLLMGRRADIAALREVIDQLDIMLAQVLIEAVILEVGLNDKLEYGIDWLQRSVTVYDSENYGSGGGATVNQPVFSFAGGTRVDNAGAFQDAAALTGRAMNLSAGALTYYATFFDLNLDAIIRLASSDRHARILQTPVILTTDNTEAKIIVGEERPIVTSTTTSSDTGNNTSHYEYKDIGIELTVTPRINPERLVVMAIKQKANNVQGTEKIDGNDVPIITKREMEAQVAVKSRSTIVLGGLIQTDESKSRSKVPILGDIPLLGALFRSESRNDYRTELLVLLTPYVLMTPEEARAETARLKNATRAGDTPWPDGWSESPLATPGPKAIARKKREEKARKKKEEEERKEADRRTRMEERRQRREQLMENPFYEPMANEAIPVDDLLYEEENRLEQEKAGGGIIASVERDEESFDPVVLTASDAEGNPLLLESSEEDTLSESDEAGPALGPSWGSTDVAKPVEPVVQPAPDGVPTGMETLTAVEEQQKVRPVRQPEENTPESDQQQLDLILRELSPE